MDHEEVLHQLHDRAPHLATNGADLDALAGTALAAWTRHPADTTESVEAATRAVVDAIWPIGYRTGAGAGHLAVAQSFAAAAVEAAEPARAGMSDRHRDLANRLHAARVTPDALRGYLTNAGWRHTGTWRGGDIFELTMTDGVAEVLVPPAGVRDHVHRIVEAVTIVADVEDRDVASMLADLAPARRRLPLSHASLRYLWYLYDTADDMADTPTSVRDPGASNRDHATAIAAGRDGDTTDRLVAAVDVGYDHGVHSGRQDGVWSASAAILSQLDKYVVAPADNDRIDGKTWPQWLQAVNADARTAARSALRDPRICAAGFPPPQLVTSAADAPSHAPLDTPPARRNRHR